MADPESILALVVLCPLCLQDEIERVLAKNGDYPRWIPTSASDGQHGKIYRKLCARCGESFSLLPDFIPRDQRYPCLLIADWLWEAMNGASCRSRDFLERQEIPCPAPEPGTCWTHLLDMERTQPGYQLLARWVTRYSDRALTAIPTLMTACIVLGRDLKAEAGRFSALMAAPIRTYPLAVALYLWSTLRGTGEPLAMELRSLVHYLLWHPRRPISHAKRHESRHRLGYDGLAVAGRPPPPAASP